MTALVQFGAVIFEHRGDGRIGLLGFEKVTGPLQSELKGRAVDLEARNVGAQTGIGEKAGFAAERVGGATCPSGRPVPRPMPLIISRSMRQKILGDFPALVEFADDLPFGHAHVVEEGLSQNGDLPETSRIGLVDTPGVRMSKRMKLMPRCFDAAGSVRTRQKIQSALSA